MRFTYRILALPVLTAVVFVLFVLARQVLMPRINTSRDAALTGDKAAVVKDWDDIVDVNIKGVFNVTHAFLDQLRNNKCRVVNIGSIQSFLHVRWPNSASNPPVWKLIS